MSYVEEALKDIFDSNTEHGELVLEQMEAEAEFIMSCLENNIILEAEANIITKGKSRLDGIINKVKEFFKRVVTDFKAKCTDMYASQAEEWLKENGDLIDKIDYTGLNIEMLPFWTVTISDITAILDKFAAALDKIPQDSKLNEIKSMADVEQMSPFKEYLKDNEKFSKSIKDYFRTAKGELKVVKISDNELKSKCTTVFKPYIENFNTDVVTMIQNRRTKLDSAMDKAKRTTSLKNVGEAFSVLENCTFAETDIRYCSNFISLMEAEEGSGGNDNSSTASSNSENKSSNSGNKSEAKPGEATKPKDVTLTDDKEPKDSNGKPIENNEQKDTLAKADDYVRYAISLNQIALSAAMDILTEKFYVYLKPLKAVVSARKDTVKKEEK